MGTASQYALEKGAAIGSIRNSTSRERLVSLKEQLESKLSEVNEAIAALDANPEFEKVHNILSKALNY